MSGSSHHNSNIANRGTLLVALLCAFGLCQCTGKTERPPVPKPNVLVILTDDQGYGDLGIHGNTAVNTPVLDNLGYHSARFDRFYVSPLCAPTRASLLTGRYHLKTGTISVSKGMEIMDEAEVTVAEIFRANGYQTGIFGKWHNGQHMPNHPLGQGFDEFFGFCGGHWSNYFDTALEHNGEMVPTSGYITDVLTDQALAFIDRAKDQPFFCYVPYNAPHSPHQVPDVYFDKYKAKGLNDELSSIYGMVENLDWNIGRLLSRLDELGIAENTIVLFLTDNGPNGVRYNAGMKGIKGSVDEGGVRVPCFWRWQGVIEPGLIKMPAAHIDILPTLVELCLLKMPETRPIDGISLAPVLRGTSMNIKRQLFTHVAQPQLPLKPVPSSVRRWPYALIASADGEYLYDLETDSAQYMDVRNELPFLFDTLRRELDSWYESVSSSLQPIPRITLSHTVAKIELPTYESTFSGGLRFKEGHGWVHDWLVNWTAIDDSIQWDITSPIDQDFEVYLNYTCPEGQQGSMVIVSIAGNSVSGQITEVFDPGFIPSPDRVKRKEVYEKKWNRLMIGSIRVPAGNHTLLLTAADIAHDHVGEIRSIELVRSP
jgi:arylsulfatase A